MKELKRRVSLKEGNNNGAENGITLIALVVTIVVLLILAGITITMLFSENGIITKARQAAEETAKAEENETAGMQNMVDQMNDILDSMNAVEITLDQTEADMTVGGDTLTLTVTPADTEVTWTTSDENIATVEDGVVTAVAEGEATITATTAAGKTATCVVTVAAE